MPFDQPQWFRNLNPLCRIPALKDGDLVLADSSVICQYIEDKNRNLTPLLGQNAEQHAKVRWLEKYADYELAPLTTFTIFQNHVVNSSMKKPTDEGAVQSALKEKLPVHFDYLEQSLGKAEYFVGDTLSLADLPTCRLGVCLSNNQYGARMRGVRWYALAESCGAFFAY